MARWLSYIMTPFLALLEQGVQSSSYVRIELNKLGHYFPVKKQPEMQYTFLLQCYAQGMDLPERWSWDYHACEEFCRERRLQRVHRGNAMLFTKGIFI